MWLHRIVPILALASFLTSCVHEAPATSQLQFDVPQCAGTASGHACITLSFSVSDSVREHTKRPLKGTLHWAFYKAGDVGLLGPGDNHSVYGGEVPNVDLTSDTPIEITVPDVDARAYQALAYLDVMLRNTGDASSGDPVTFPGDAFNIARDVHTRVAIVFDFIR